LRIAQRLVALAEATPGLRLAVGADGEVFPFYAAKTALRQARVANQACMRTHRWSIRFYNELRMELIVEGLSDAGKSEFITRLFSGYSDNEIVDAIIMLENYYETEGSIQQTAARLYIHKNTLQYKLKKIAERTGYDPRSIRHSSLFYNAIFFYRDLSARGAFAKIG
jgi:carbohydrate diacid regulator